MGCREGGNVEGREGGWEGGRMEVKEGGGREGGGREQGQDRQCEQDTAWFHAYVLW